MSSDRELENAARYETLLADFWADVEALVNGGLLDRTEKNQIEFPFAAVRVEFTLRAA